MESYKQYFSKALGANDKRLHFAAHSHHLWPDCTEAAHHQAWLDATILADDKWDQIFGQVIPEAQAHIAKRLSLPDPMTICFAPNTHEFLVRLHSALPENPSVLTTDAEFHSFTRQRRRWEEAENTEFEVVPAEPFEDFGARFLRSAARYEHDMIYISQVFFNSGYVVEILDALVEIVRGRNTLLVIDGYHAFMALPVSLETIHDRVFYIAGGYKYAMAGEGVCFMHCPPGFAMRPVNTGWFAGFGDLESGVEQIAYSSDGRRFAGATFDACGMHRFNAVQRLFDALDLSVLALHERTQVLQNQFLDGLVAARIDLGEFIPGAGGSELGHFLTFRSERAERLTNNLAEQGVMVDFRKDRLRFGFALYHDPDDVVKLLKRLEAVASGVNAKASSASAIDSAIASAIVAESRVTGPFEAVRIPDETGVDESGVDESGVDESGVDESGVDESGVDESGVDESGVDESGVDESGVDESGVDESGVDESGVDESGVDESGVNESGVNKLVAAESFADESGAADVDAAASAPQGRAQADRADAESGPADASKADTGTGVVTSVVLAEESVGSKFDASDVDAVGADAVDPEFDAPAAGAVTAGELIAPAESASASQNTLKKKRKKKKKKKA